MRALIVLIILLFLILFLKKFRICLIQFFIDKYHIIIWSFQLLSFCSWLFQLIFDFHHFLIKIIYRNFKFFYIFSLIKILIIYILIIKLWSLLQLINFNWAILIHIFVLKDTQLLHCLVNKIQTRKFIKILLFRILVLEFFNQIFTLFCNLFYF